MVWMRNKESNFPIHSLIWRPECIKFYCTNLNIKHSSLPTLAVIVLPVSRCSPYIVIIDPPATGPIAGLILEMEGSYKRNTQSVTRLTYTSMIQYVSN